MTEYTATGFLHLIHTSSILVTRLRFQCNYYHIGCFVQNSGIRLKEFIIVVFRDLMFLCCVLFIDYAGLHGGSCTEVKRAI